MLYKQRKHFKKLSEKVGYFFSKLSISPNQWTLLSLFLALIVFYFLVNQNFILSFVFCIITISIDMIDGAVARATKKSTKFGAYLDTTVDRFIEFFIIFGLLFLDYPNFIFNSKTWLVLLLFGSMLSTYSKAAALEKGLIKEELKGGGILEHTDRLILFLIIILISYFSLNYAIYLIAITAILTFVSFLQRFYIVTKGKI
ncbi:MAG: CDP-alcohol phosphatidyltransferase family protein [Candidatus Aenigmatarchaeota archaeon]